MENLVEISVFIEAQAKVITLKVSPADAQRAQIDSRFLKNLVQRYTQATAPSESETSERCTQATGLAAPSEPDTSEAANKDSSLFIWSSSCVHLLLCLYEERAADFTSGVKRHNKIWQEIADIMVKHGHHVTGPQCQSKLNGLKKTYKKIIDHNNASGNDRMTWPYFDKMNDIFGSSSWANPKALATEAGPSSPLDAPRNSPKKRKHKLVEKIEERQKEREKRKQEWQRLKAQKIDELMLQKEKQHREKMELMNALIQTFRKEN